MEAIKNIFSQYSTFRHPKLTTVFFEHLFYMLSFLHAENLQSSAFELHVSSSP